MSQSLFYLTTAVHVSGVSITHLQEHKTTVTTASGNRYTVLLSAAVVEELEHALHDQTAQRQVHWIQIQRAYNHIPTQTYDEASGENVVGTKN
jgi:predicted nucleic acid-binding protein